MRRGKQIIGMEVLSLADGRRTQTIKDLIIGSDNESVVALLVDEGGLLSSSLVIPYESIESFGRDAIVISSLEAVLPADRYEPVAKIVASNEKLVGKRVYTETGDHQGSISDVYFDEQSGLIRGLEVSQGILGDAARGTSYLPVEDITRGGPELVYIRPEAVGPLDAQVGGLQGTIEDARTRASKAADTAGRKLKDYGREAGKRTSKAGADVGAEVRERQPEESLVGRRAGTDVADDRGDIIVAAGQRITADHVERAREANKVHSLTGAATTGAIQEAGETAGRVGADLGDAAGSAWDRFMKTVNDWTDSTGKRFDEERTKKRLADIEDAVGRPVTKVILDRKDTVLLNLGDIITHEAVQKAYDAGGLDSLLGNVYKGPVEFTKEEMRAPDQAARTAITIERASGQAPLLEEMLRGVEAAEHERKTQREQERSQAETERERREQEREQRSRERSAEARKEQAEAGVAKATKPTRSRPTRTASR